MTLVNVDPWAVLDRKTHVSVLFFFEPGQLHFQRPVKHSINSDPSKKQKVGKKAKVEKSPSGSLPYDIHKETQAEDDDEIQQALLLSKFEFSSSVSI